ncbi:MAG: hypothetical protein L3J89_09310 [Gammaproteobacteria bacterium]|nr:hypothetical protein [Gammaproteobacteria bacterium]
MPPLNLTSRLAVFPLFLLVLIVLVLPGCFHNDDDPAPVPDATPAGYYINTGTATVSDGGSSTISIGDLQAIVHGSRMMMMSVTHELLYDGTITSIDGNDYTADFRIYKDAVFVTDATVTGQITTGASITGILTGSGFGSGGGFNLLYGTTNHEVASLARIERVLPATWGATIGGADATADYEFTIDDVGGVVDDVSNVDGLFDSCFLNFEVSIIRLIVDTNFYEPTFLVHCNGGGFLHEGEYTGLATTRSDATTDDTLVLMMTSGTHSFSGDFK